MLGFETHFPITVIQHSSIFSVLTVTAVSLAGYIKSSCSKQPCPKMLNQDPECNGAWGFEKRGGAKQDSHNSETRAKRDRTVQIRAFEHSTCDTCRREFSVFCSSIFLRHFVIFHVFFLSMFLEGRDLQVKFNIFLATTLQKRLLIRC